VTLREWDQCLEDIQRECNAAYASRPDLCGQQRDGDEFLFFAVHQSDERRKTAVDILQMEMKREKADIVALFETMMKIKRDVVISRGQAVKIPIPDLPELQKKNFFSEDCRLNATARDGGILLLYNYFIKSQVDEHAAYQRTSEWISSLIAYQTDCELAKCVLTMSFSSPTRHEACTDSHQTYVGTTEMLEKHREGTLADFVLDEIYRGKCVAKRLNYNDSSLDPIVFADRTLDQFAGLRVSRVEAMVFGAAAHSFLQRALNIVPVMIIFIAISSFMVWGGSLLRCRRGPTHRKQHGKENAQKDE
jgi:hypothetical protein